MPCAAWGSSHSSTSPPSSRISVERSARTPRRRRPRSPRPRADKLPRHAEAKALRGRRAMGSSTPPSIPTEVESQGSRPSMAPQQERRVGDVAGQRPALVERGGEGDHPVAGDRPVGGLQADDPAERRGLADRAAGVGADRPGRQPARDRRRRAARRPSRDPLAIPGVAHGPVAGVLVRGAHRELVHVRLAEQPGAGVGEPAHRGGRVRRPVALQDPRPGGGLDPLGAEDVLDGDRRAAERARRRCREAPGSARHR